MTSRPSTAPTYVDLAKAGARIERSIAPSRCPRLTEQVVNLKAVEAELAFFWDDQGRIRVDGTVAAQVQLDCQACSQPVSMDISSDIAGIIVRDEDEAMQLPAQDEELSAIVVGSSHLDEVELVEDELLLRLPSQVCTDRDCDKRPGMSYGPLEDGSEERNAQTGTHRPFAALAALRQTQGRDED